MPPAGARRTAAQGGPADSGRGLMVVGNFKVPRAEVGRASPVVRHEFGEKSL
jgi:hypothetical protein